MIRRTGLCTRRSKGFERKNPMFKGGERERREFNSRHFCMTTEFRVTKMLIKPAHFPLEKSVPVIQRVRIRLSGLGPPRHRWVVRSIPLGDEKQIENKNGMDERIPSTGYLFVGDPILNRRSLTFLMGDLIVIGMLGGKDRGTQAVWRTKLAEIDRNVSRYR